MMGAKLLCSVRTVDCVCRATGKKGNLVHSKMEKKQKKLGTRLWNTPHIQWVSAHERLTSGWTSLLSRMLLESAEKVRPNQTNPTQSLKAYVRMWSYSTMLTCRILSITQNVRRLQHLPVGPMIATNVPARTVPERFLRMRFVTFPSSAFPLPFLTTML